MKNKTLKKILVTCFGLFSIFGTIVAIDKVTGGALTSAKDEIVDKIEDLTNKTDENKDEQGTENNGTDASNEGLDTGTSAEVPAN